MFFFGADKILGTGLPWNNHWSTFGVWRIKPALREMDAAGWWRYETVPEYKQQ